jgi:hypothetical protein
MKLTKQIREEILEALLDHAFGAQEKELLQQEHVLAGEVYNELYTQEERDFMEKVGSKRFYTTSHLSYHSDNSGWGRLKLNEPKFEMPKGTPYNGKLLGKIEAYRDAYTTLGKVRSAARDEAQGILNSVTTAKRLIEVWPEIASFVPTERVTSRNLPALQVVELNRILGVPPSGK